MSARRPASVAAALLLGIALTLACGRGGAPTSGERPAATAGAEASPGGAAEAGVGSTTGEDPEAAAAEAARRAELPHQVVFADRILYPYVLLLPAAGEGKPATPSRGELQAEVQRVFAGKEGEPEVGRLLAMIGQAPSEAGAASPTLLEPNAGDEAGAGEGGVVTDPSAYRPARELLALHVEVIAASEVVSQGALEDPELTRALSPEDRASLAGRRWALVLRGEYRNQEGVRGLRLLQTLVRIAASERGALIHDPDTLETVDVATFTARRLLASVGNIADQIPVIPFPDPRHEGRLRLATRGMRRFGSVDLELDGLPPDPERLQRATFLLHGLALAMARLGEVDRSGFAVEAPEVIDVSAELCRQAYGSRGGGLPRCRECPEDAVIHLVERPAEPQDPPGHVVARVVAPRVESDAADYDHPAWVEAVLARLFGSLK